MVVVEVLPAPPEQHCQFDALSNVLQTIRGCVAVTVEITAPQTNSVLDRVGTPCLEPQ